MPRFKDLTGQRFTHLLVLECLKERNKHGQIMYRCVCDCGNKISISGGQLTARPQKSCGCVKTRAYKGRERPHATLGPEYDGTVQDLTGHRFGKLVAIEPAGKTASGGMKWLCDCDCGNRCIAIANSLKCGTTKSCRCLKSFAKFSTEDLSGNVFGKLTVLQKVPQKPHIQTRWECLCECGNKKEVAAHDLKWKQTTSCGCLWKETIVKAIDAAAKSHLLEGSAAAENAKIGCYKSSARYRKLSMELTKEQFQVLFRGDCFYCGKPPSQISPSNSSAANFIYNGIDRLNPKVGYVWDNCVSCCKVCNYGKGTLNYEEFCEWIERVYFTLNGERNAEAA